MLNKFSFIQLGFCFLSINLFFIGLFGIIVNRANLIIMLMSVEIMLLGINVSFLFYSVLLDDLVGLIFVFFILTVAAAESAIGLAITVAFYRAHSSIEVGDLQLLRN